MKCKMCDKNTGCSCRGGKCPNCGSNSTQVSVMNALLDFGLDKSILISKLQEVHQWTNKIDNYTLYEYINGDITLEQLQEASAEYLNNKTTSTYISAYKKEIEDFKQTENPNEYCVFEGNGPRVRCKYCNKIRKYVKPGEKCLAAHLDNNEK